MSLYEIITRYQERLSESIVRRRRFADISHIKIITQNIKEICLISKRWD